MNIRAAINQDAASIASVGLCVWVDTYATEGVRDSLAKYVLEEFTEDNIANVIRTEKVYVAEENGHISGYAVLSIGDKLTEIESLYVLPRFQSNGLGRSILDHIMANYSEVWLSCWQRNESAIRFYKSFGFSTTGESCFEMENENHKNVILSYSPKGED